MHGRIFLVGDLLATLLAFSIILILTISDYHLCLYSFVLWTYIVPGTGATYFEDDCSEVETKVIVGISTVSNIESDLHHSVFNVVVYVMI